MKLTDISATTGSRAATAKLARQVQKASVAAGKEPRTNLGVLGISIGQTQSKGLTSRVSEAVSGTHAYDIIVALGETINKPFAPPNQYGEPVKFDKDEVMHDAMQIISMLRVGPDFKLEQDVVSKALPLLNNFAALRRAFGSGNYLTLDNAADKAEEAGWTPSAKIEEVLNANAVLVKMAKTLEQHFETVEAVVNYVSALPYMLGEKSELDAHDKAMVRAVLKQFGMLS